MDFGSRRDLRNSVGLSLWSKAIFQYYKGCTHSRCRAGAAGFSGTLSHNKRASHRTVFASVECVISNEEHIVCRHQVHAVAMEVQPRM
jgi:hypothetical protein